MSLYYRGMLIGWLCGFIGCMASAIYSPLELWDDLTATTTENQHDLD